MTRILIVDDSLVMRKTIRMILEQVGYQVIAEAAGGKEAYNEYAKFQPDLVTMDLSLPDMDGTQAISRIVADFPRAKIVVISAFGQKKRVIEAIKCGAMHFVVKPIDDEKLITAIRKVLIAKVDDAKRDIMLTKLEQGMDDGEENDCAAAAEVKYHIEDRHDKYTLVKFSEGFSSPDLRDLPAAVREKQAAGNTRFLFEFDPDLVLDEAVRKELNNLVAQVQQAGGTINVLTAYRETMVAGRKAAAADPVAAEADGRKTNNES